MSSFEILFIFGAVVGTGFFNLAIGVLTKICNKPFYTINHRDVTEFLLKSKDETGNHSNQILKYKLYMFFAIFGMLISFVAGLIQTVISNQG